VTDTSANPVIATHRLTKRFGAVLAVDALDLEVARGEIFGFLGPNGAGKTTTIRCLFDFIRPTSGTATMLGGSGADPAVRARVGYMPGDLDLDPTYTTDDVVELFGGLRGGVDRKLVARLLERFELDPTRPIGQLSTGNRRKVGIVQAFMHRPELLVLDEPSSGLDPLLQRELQDLIREHRDHGATVFLSSHVLPEVERVADRVAILRRGKLITVSTIDALRLRARQRIQLFVEGDGDPARFRDLPGVVEVSAVDGIVDLVVEGSVDPVIKAAATLRVTRVVTHNDDLEDIFLELYREAES